MTFDEKKSDWLKYLRSLKALDHIPLRDLETILNELCEMNVDNLIVSVDYVY
jgi:hypothetical protein